MKTMKRMQSCCCCCCMMTDTAYIPRVTNTHNIIYTRKKPKEHEKNSIYISIDYRIAS